MRKPLPGHTCGRHDARTILSVATSLKTLKTLTILVIVCTLFGCGRYGRPVRTTETATAPSSTLLTSGRLEVPDSAKRSTPPEAVTAISLLAR